MEREFPKNVKQIGNVSDEPKIYVEDYVDTYLNQLKEKAVSEPVGAVLTGEILCMDGQDVVYVAGALQLHNIEVEGTEIKLQDEAWKIMEEEKQRFFSGQDLVGWCLIEEGQPMGINRAIRRIHEKKFARENTVFIWRDATITEEVFYANKFGELMQMGGHYIFYEKNPSMQNYMINTRKKIGVTPSEMVEDRAAKDFRSTVRGKLEYKEQRQNARFAYLMSVALVVVVLVIGISTINNYDKMESVQNSLEALSQSVSQPQTKEATVEEELEDGGQAAKQQEPEQKEAEQKESEQQEQTVPQTADAGETESKEVSSDKIESKEETAEAEAQEDLENQEYYVVQKGDTLDGISIKIYGNRRHVDAICRMNGLSDGNLIIIGQKLLLP